MSKTEISEEAHAKALRLLNHEHPHMESAGILAIYIQQVSDAAKEADREIKHWAGKSETGCLDATDHLAPLILPDPVDPLDEVLESLPANIAGCIDGAERLRAELAKRGLKIIKEADQ